MSAFDLPLVQAGMHGLYTGHITHGTRFGMKYYAKNVVPDFCVSCASVKVRPKGRQQLTIVSSDKEAAGSRDATCGVLCA